jgi:diadenosine tetraphosphate (Ap4A) HIT family hydrolase
MQQFGPSYPGIMVENARSGEYAAVLAKAAARGECMLDQNAIDRYDLGGSVITRLGGWVLAGSTFPYPHAEDHLLAFPERHITSPAELTTPEKIGFWDILDAANELAGVTTAAAAMRYSYENHHEQLGATLKHLHHNILAPVLDPSTGRVPGYGTPSAEVVTIRIG